LQHDEICPPKSLANDGLIGHRLRGIGARNPEAFNDARMHRLEYFHRSFSGRGGH
jgi:hypothetical protein